MARYDVVLVRRIQAAAAAPTMVEVAPIRQSGFTWTQTVGAPGSVAVTCTVDSLEADAKAALLDLSAAPCELWVYRDDVRVHAGPITDYQIDARSLTLVAPGLAVYIDYMVRTTDYAVTSTDQATIAKALIDTYQALTYGDFGLDTHLLTATGITRDLTLVGAELHPLKDVIAEMGGRDNGFDLDVDPTSRTVLMYSPFQGSDLSANVFLTARSIGNPRYAQHVGPGQLASAVAVTSTSADGLNLTSSDEDAGLVASFGRVMTTAAFQDVSVQATLDDHAARLLADHDTPLHEVTPGLIAVPGFEYGDFAKGDTITYEYDAGLGAQTFALRVKTIEITTDQGVEQMSVGFF